MPTPENDNDYSSIGSIYSHRSPSPLTHPNTGLSNGNESPSLSNFSDHGGGPGGPSTKRRRRNDDDIDNNGEMDAERGRGGALATNRTKHRQRFWDIKGTHAKRMFCDFEYSNNIIQNPALRSQMQSLQSNITPFGSLLNLDPNSATKCDMYGDTIPLSILRPPGFSHPSQIGTSRAYYNKSLVPTDKLLHAKATPLGDNKKCSDAEMDRQREEKLAEQEALFLRRAILVQNDLFTKGDDIIVGAEAAEKNLPRKPQDSEQTIEQIMERIEKTFEMSKKLEIPDDSQLSRIQEEGIIQHPINPKLKLKQVYPILPNAEQWATNLKQVTFAEPTNIEINDQNPDILWQNQRSVGRTLFGLFSESGSGSSSNNNRRNDDDDDDVNGGEHGLKRPYVWANQGEFELNIGKDKSNTNSYKNDNCSENIVNDGSGFVLMSFQSGIGNNNDNNTHDSDPSITGDSVRFTRISSKMQMRKQKAQLQTGNVQIEFDLTNTSGSSSLSAEEKEELIMNDNEIVRSDRTLKRKIVWRNPTEAERNEQIVRFHEVVT